MKSIFVDTSAWVSLNCKSDMHFNNAVKANKNFLDAGYYYVSSEYILDETYTLLRLDIGHKRTIEFGYEIKELIKIKQIKIFTVNEIIINKAWDIFEKYSDKSFSFTDCTSFAIMETFRINKAFTFDNHFEQYGFVRLPIL